MELSRHAGGSVRHYEGLERRQIASLDYKKQLLTYLRLTKKPLGLLLNFGAETLRDGLHSVANNLDPSDSPLLRVNLAG